MLKACSRQLCEICQSDHDEVSIPGDEKQPDVADFTTQESILLCDDCDRVSMNARNKLNTH